MGILDKSAESRAGLHRRLPIAKEGYPFIISTAMATAIFGFLGWVYLAGIFCGFTFFVISFFRNPNRTPPSSENTIVSPADGKILKIENHPEREFLHRDTVKISIFMSLFDVHVNRSPMTGRIMKTVYSPGKFFAANTDKSSLLNERNILLLCSNDGFEILFIQIAGIIARRIVCYPKQGDFLLRGQIFGMIRFGSRLEVFLPRGVDIQVREGDSVRAGETILGYRNVEKAEDRH
jgi:phosphatidylserine decarboxylase